jgi:hypothetical protein
VGSARSKAKHADGSRPINGGDPIRSTTPVHAGTPTNSPRDGKKVQPDVLVGIDTIRVRGTTTYESLSSLPTQRDRLDLDLSTGELVRRQTSGQTRVDDRFTLYADGLRRRPEAIIEVSVPRLLRGDNRQPASVREVHSLIADLHEAAARWIAWTCSPEEMSLMRVDFCRDIFGVPNPQAVLYELGRVPAVRARTVLHMNQACAGVETLSRKTTRWEVRGYDRREAYLAQSRATGTTAEAEKLRGLAASESGKVRIEAQLRSTALAAEGLGVVGDLIQPLADAVGRKFIVDRARMTVRVGGGVANLRDADAALCAINKGREMGGMIGQVVIDHYDLLGQQSEPTRRKLRGLAATYGVNMADIVDAKMEPTRLDFDLGLCLRGQAALRSNAVHGVGGHVAARAAA